MTRFVLFLSPGRIVLALSLLVTGYLLFSAGGNLVQSYRLADDETRLRQEVDGLRAREERLKQIREYLRSDEYIEYMARHVFGLVKPGETLVIVQSPEEPQDRESLPPGRPWWEEIFGR